MSKPLVYLAGAIAGQSYDGATNWRDLAFNMLYARSIEALNPMRAKTKLRGADVIRGREYYELGLFYTSKGIIMRDFNDVKRADALLVNLRGLTSVSVGTAIELGWAHMRQVPVVTIIESCAWPDTFQNPHHEHPMVKELLGFEVPTLEEGVDAIGWVLNR